MILKKSCFSLLEMMVVIAIIASIMGIAAVKFMDSAEEANVGTTRASIKGVEDALQLYKLSKKQFPKDLQALVESGKMDSLPLDAWGNPINYQFPGSGSKPFDVWSLGADGQDGGEGFNADIYNHEEE